MDVAHARAARFTGWVRRAGLPAALALALLAPLAVPWAQGRTLAWFDSLRLYAPARGLVDEALRSLRLPLWNPFLGTGVPLFAEGIHGVLHPVSVVTAFLGTGRSVDLLIAGHALSAGFGGYWLGRELGASRAAAAVSGIAYGLSGFVLSMAGNLVFLAGAGSLPLCLAGLRRAAAVAAPSGIVLGAAGAAALALTGDAQSLMAAGALGVALAWEAGGWRGAARAATAGSLGLLVAAVQLVPSAHAYLLSERAGAGWAGDPRVWALEPWRVAELVLPGLLWGDDPLMDPVYGALAGPGRWMAGGLPRPFSASVAFGLLPAALAAAGVAAGRRGRLLGVLALVLLWMALGPALGAGHLLEHVPVWGAFRYPEKLVGPLTLLLAALAGLGTDALLDRRVGARGVLAAALGAGLLAVVACRVAASGLPVGLAGEAQARIGRGTWHLVGASAALGAWLLVRHRLPEAGRRGLLAVLVWAGAAAAAPAALRPGEPAARLRAPGPSIEAPPPGPRIVAPYTYEPLDLAPGGDWIDVAAREYAAKGYVALNVRSRLDSVDHYQAMTPRRLATLQETFGIRWPAAARRYAVTHVVADPPRSEEHRVRHALATDGGVRLDAGGGGAEVWAVPHRPWASFPPEVRVVPDESAALQEVMREVVGDSPAVTLEGAGRFETGPGELRSVERGLDALRIEARSDGPSTLVVADAWWPGWEARIDGVAVPIFRADLLLRAVRWPAGSHVLEMAYRPPELRTGIALSLAGLAALTAWGAWGGRVLARAARARPSIGGGRGTPDGDGGGRGVS